MRHMQIHGCHDCPLRGESKYAGPVCRALHIAIELGTAPVAPGPPPQWCPLRDEGFHLSLAPDRAGI